MLKLFLTLVAVTVVLTGCNLAPNYERPVLPVAQSWPSPAARSTSADAASAVAVSSGKNATATQASELGWREFFVEPQLQTLIALALENNRDLRLAWLNVEQSRARYRIQRADLVPTLGANAVGTRQRTPSALAQPGQPLTQSQYSVTADISAFELDVWGRVRSLSRRALEQYFSTEEARRSVQLSLVAEVANQYVSERAAAAQLVLAKQTEDVVRRSLELTQQRFNAGTTSELDLRTSVAQYQTARANVAIYTRQRALAENALMLLVGHALPADLSEAEVLNDRNFIAEIPVGIPSDLLQQRPDLLQAEHALKAANANIGAARAAFFPSISLTASGGTSSTAFSQLFDAGTGYWLFQPVINLPIFSGGRNRANLDVAKVSTRIEVANYEKAIQTTFREVSDALVSRVSLNEQMAAVTARVASEQRRYDLSDQRYRTGVDNYVTVLLAQQDLYAAQQTLIDTRLSRLSNSINLYKALGGGALERTKDEASPRPLTLTAVRSTPAVASK